MANEVDTPEEGISRTPPRAILDKLEQLQLAEEALEKIKNDKALAVNSLMPLDLKRAIAQLEMQFDVPVQTMELKILALTDEIKAAALEHKGSVKATHNMVVYSKGRVVWDTAGLDGFAIAHPEIKAFKDYGEPVISIRKVK